LLILANCHLWETAPCIQTNHHAEGCCVFESFKQSATLNTIYCQTGQNAEQVAFREALLRLRTYSTTSEDFELFSGCFWDYLTEQRMNLMMSFIFCQHKFLFWSLTVGDCCRISNCSSPYCDRDSPDRIYLSSASER
jgi:hypothetical protein